MTWTRKLRKDNPSSYSASMPRGSYYVRDDDNDNEGSSGLGARLQDIAGGCRFLDSSPPHSHRMPACHKMDCETGEVPCENPAETIGLTSALLFWWINPLLIKGYKFDLNIQDIFRPLEKDDATLRADILNEELLKLKGEVSRRHGLAEALIRVYGGCWLALGMVTGVEELGTRIFQCLSMRWFAQHFASDNHTITRTDAILYGSGYVSMGLIFCLIHHWYFLKLERIGMSIRISCCTLVYRKALRMGRAAVTANSVGHIVNLLSNDVDKFDRVAMYSQWLWIGPLQLILVGYLSWREMGPWTTVGLSLLLLGIPLQVMISKQFSRLRAETARKTDIRIGIMNEIIDGIKVIKMYAWEHAFAKSIGDARRNEMDVVSRINIFRGFNVTYSNVTTTIAFVVILVPYITLAGGTLRAESIFLVLSLFSIVKQSMTDLVPNSMKMIGEALISISRIEAFLEGEELCEEEGEVIALPAPKDAAATLSDLRARWGFTAAVDTLKSISLEVKMGQLCAVIGPVGSGKSSLLQCLLGEMNITSGARRVSGTVSYASQDPWVFSGSVRQNVLFGCEMDDDRYARAIRACALERDLAAWAHGDHTLVGEKGVALSGGQKARVSLARAVYREADVYLLDDPLSAVDARVVRHLFRNCIRGHLAGKTVILVTHQLQCAREADHVCLMENGTLAGSGSYDRVVAESKSPFLAHFAADAEEDYDEEAFEDHRHVANVKPKDLLDDDDDDDDDETRRPKIGSETRATGVVKFSTYQNYAVASKSTGRLLVYAVLLVSANVVSCWSNVLLGKWSTIGVRSENSTEFECLLNHSSPFGADLQGCNELYLAVYAGSILVYALLAFAYALTFFTICTSASRTLHDDMFFKVLRAPMAFFDGPVGRVLNRFSKDLGITDETLPYIAQDVLASFVAVLGLMAVICLSQPLILLPSAAMLALFYLVRRFYVATSRSVQRLEGVARSPLFSHLASSVRGLATIRAFRAEAALIAEFDHLQNVHTATWFTSLSASRWMASIMEWIILFYSAICVYSFIIFEGDYNSGAVALVMTSCMQMSGLTQYAIRESALLETIMTSVERILEYGCVEPEAPLVGAAEGQDCPLGNRIQYWRRSGKEGEEEEEPSMIELYGVSLRYSPGEKYVLRGLSFKIQRREKIGVVGRTGAGKSSLVAALFRLAEPEGAIFVGGRFTKDLGLHELRRNISIIPQEPLLFAGTLRGNLDPLGEHDDRRLFEALSRVKLDAAGFVAEAGLEARVSEGGANLSAGEAQLVCLARAILRRNEVLVLDEATANVDAATDALVQEAIRTCFSHCTIITIAHRLHTVMDSDRIMVLEDGMLKEFDHPHNLLRRESSLLTRLAKNTGDRGYLELARIAQDTFDKGKR